MKLACPNRNMKKAAALAGLAFVLAAAGFLAAQENLGRGRITGDVADETGAPVAGAKVIVESLQGTARLEAVTDKKGHFAVAGLGSGQWRITVSKEGYINAFTEMQVSQLKSNPPQALTMKKAAGLQGFQADKESQGLLDTGNVLLEEGKFDEALAAFEEFSAKYPELYQVRLNIATAHLKKGDLDKAEAEFKAVLDKIVQVHGDQAKDKSTSLRAMTGLGEVAMKKGDLDAAQRSFREALTISPEDEAAAYNVGEIFFSNQKIDEAIQYFELAIRIKSAWPKPYYRLGLAYLNKGDYPKALEYLNKFVELDPQNPEVPNVKNIISTLEKMKK